jgi:hypothetical protein
MTLDVTWDGVVLAKGAQAREQDGGWFVELEQPMPVGTTLDLAGEVQGRVQVARVHEGIGAGMIVRKVDSPQSTVDSPKAAAPEPGAKADDSANADDGAADDGAKPENGGKKEKRKRGRRS